MIKVMIDPGHGGSDRSNKGSNGYVEADGVLSISTYLKTALERSSEVTVSMTRTTDSYLSLTARGKMAEGYDLFISEHTNAGGGSGTEVYYSVDIPGDKNFASSMSSKIATVLGIKNRGAKTKESSKYPGEDYYTVIDTAQDIGCAHVLLVESAFHDNEEEEALLLQAKYLKLIAEAQAEAICYYMGTTYVESTESTEELTFTKALEILEEKTGISKDYWIDKENIDKYFSELMIKIASAT